MLATEEDVKVLLPVLATADDVSLKILLPMLAIAEDVPPKRLAPVLIEYVLAKGALTRSLKLVSFLGCVNSAPLGAGVDDIDEVDETRLEPNLKADLDSKEGAEADTEMLLLLVVFGVVVDIGVVKTLLLELLDELWPAMLSGSRAGSGEENDRIESASDPFKLEVLVGMPNENMPIAGVVFETEEDNVSFELEKAPAFKLFPLSFVSGSGSFVPELLASTALKAKLQNKQGKKSNKIP